MKVEAEAKVEAVKAEAKVEVEAAKAEVEGACGRTQEGEGKSKSMQEATGEKVLCGLVFYLQLLCDTRKENKLTINSALTMFEVLQLLINHKLSLQWC